jgi:hypothetical protein
MKIEITEKEIQSLCIQHLTELYNVDPEKIINSGVGFTDEHLNGISFSCEIEIHKEEV